MKTLKRRRRENKTDYGRRINLLKAGVPRIVFRKSNKYITAQYVISEEAKDKIIIGITSGILSKYGWPEDMKGSLKSIPASYLTGFLIGKKIMEKKLETPVVDIGMIRSVNKNRAFAFIMGIVDSGIKIKYKRGTLPDEERIKGKKLKRDFSVIFSKVKSKIEGGKNEN